MGDAIKLIGIVIVIIGFALKFDTLATVVVAGIVTGLVGGMSIMDILSTLGAAFLTNRTATLFILTLPVIGICERMGLRDKAVDFIRGIKSATTGRLLSIWQVIRTIASAFSLRIGGHPQFIRPLINPMAQACAIAKYGEVDEKTEDEIKAALKEKYPDKEVSTMNKYQIILKTSDETTDLSKANKYTLENEDGYITVFKYNKEGKKELVEKTSIQIKSLPKSVQEELKEAIVLDNEEDAYSRLEDFGS